VRWEPCTVIWPLTFNKLKLKTLNASASRAAMPNAKWPEWRTWINNLGMLYVVIIHFSCTNNTALQSVYKYQNMQKCKANNHHDKTAVKTFIFSKKTSPLPSSTKQPPEHSMKKKHKAKIFFRLTYVWLTTTDVFGLPDLHIRFQVFVIPDVRHCRPGHSAFCILADH